jgi:hypothetical protein
VCTNFLEDFAEYALAKLRKCVIYQQILNIA